MSIRCQRPSARETFIKQNIFLLVVGTFDYIISHVIVNSEISQYKHNLKVIKKHNFTHKYPLYFSNCKLLMELLAFSAIQAAIIGRVTSIFNYYTATLITWNARKNQFLSCFGISFALTYQIL